jgi:hypothetical protein
MTRRFVSHLLFLIVALSSALAQSGAPAKPPVGVPADAQWFSGKWYRVYIEPGGWKSARQKCERLRGQLAIIKDAPTDAFIRDLAADKTLWLGAYEKALGLWMWLDGTEMKFKAWAPGQPDPHTKLQWLHTWKGGWGDANEDDKIVIGYICEWKAR